MAATGKLQQGTDAVSSSESKDDGATKLGKTPRCHSKESWRKTLENMEISNEETRTARVKTKFTTEVSEVDEIRSDTILSCMDKAKRTGNWFADIDVTQDIKHLIPKILQYFLKAGFSVGYLNNTGMLEVESSEEEKNQAIRVTINVKPFNSDTRAPIQMQHFHKPSLAITKA